MARPLSFAVGREHVSEHTAVHDASHAIVARLLGVRVLGVALHPEGGGVCEFQNPPDDGIRSARRRLLILLAGDAAEAVCPPAERRTEWWALV